MNLPELLADHWAFFAFIVGMLCLLLVAWVALREDPLPYARRDALVTECELAFYHSLAESVGEDYAIFSMVRLADLLRVCEGTPKSQSWQNKINSKHIDFVLCDPESLEPQIAIELDDPSHRRPDRIERDRFVNDAMAAARLPFLRVKAESEYDADDLLQSIEKTIERTAA